MATRFRKSRRQRGSRYCGWGQIGQHRQSGSRGGIGNAGKHKHFWIRTVIEEPDHFGHDPFNSHNRNLVNKWINVRDLDSLFQKTLSRGEDQRKANKGRHVMDLTSLGYDKLLGGGQIQSALEVKVDRISTRAKDKIEAAGGKVILNEKYSTK